MTDSIIQESTFDVLWPSGRRTFALSDSVQRVSDLSGKTIALVWDYLFRGDEIFDIVAGKLTAAYPGVKFVPYQVFGNVHGSQQRELIAQMPAKLREHGVDAAICAIGA